MNYDINDKKLQPHQPGLFFTLTFGIIGLKSGTFICNLYFLYCANFTAVKIWVLPSPLLMCYAIRHGVITCHRPTIKTAFTYWHQGVCDKTKSLQQRVGTDRHSTVLYLSNSIFFDTFSYSCRSGLFSVYRCLIVTCYRSDIIVGGTLCETLRSIFF